MKQLLLIHILILPLTCFSQVEWAFTLGSSESEYPGAIFLDDQENLYTYGMCSQQVDLDPGTSSLNYTSQGAWDLFLQKLDSDGNLIWACGFGGEHDEYGYDMIVSDSGHVFVCGIFRDTVDFDPGSGVFNLISDSIYWSNFLLKLDANGAFLWAKIIASGNSNNYNSYYSMKSDSQSNIYLTGYFQGSLDFDFTNGIDSLTSAGETDIFLEKIQSNGDYSWAKTFGGAQRDRAYDLAIDNEMNIYLTGDYEDSADFDPSSATYMLYAQGGYDNYVLKVDSTGNIIWTKSFGGPYIGESSYAIDVDAEHSVFVTGRYQLNVDFDPGPSIQTRTSNGGYDGFLLKLDSIGTYQWVNTFGDISLEEGYSIECTDQGNVFVSGIFAQTVDFDSGPGVYNLTSNSLLVDVFVQKLDTDGNLIYVRRIGGPSEEQLPKMAISPNEACYISTSFSEEITLNIGGTNVLFTVPGFFGNKTDILTVKLGESASIPQLEEKSLTIFPNPVNHGTLYFSEGLSQFSYKVLSSSGKLIQIGTVHSNYISLEYPAPGLYFLILENEGQQLNAKFIVE